jgi:hypothetical protein
MLTPQHVFSEYRVINVDGIVFQIGITKYNVVTAIQTNDTNFSTYDGFSMSSTLDEMMKSSPCSLKRNKGFAFVFPLLSNWFAAFIADRNEKPSGEDSPAFFYRALLPDYSCE